MVENRNHLFDTLGIDCDSWNVLSSFCVHIDLVRLKVTCKSAEQIINDCRSYKKYKKIYENILMNKQLIDDDIKQLTFSNINSLYPFYNPIQKRIEECTLLCIFSWQNRFKLVEYLLEFSGFHNINVNKGARWELSGKLDWILQYCTVLTYLTDGLGYKFAHIQKEYKHNINQKIRDLLEKHGAETGALRRDLSLYGYSNYGGCSSGVLRDEIFEKNWGGQIKQNIDSDLEKCKRKLH